MVTEGDAPDRRVLVGVPVVRRGAGREETGVHRDLELARPHRGAAVDHRDLLQRVERAADVLLLGALRRVVGVDVRGPDEPGRRVVVAGDAAHVRARAERGEVGPAHDRVLGEVRRDVEVVAQVLVVPVEPGLVREHVDVVLEHVQAVRRVLEHDRALRVGDDPVQHRAGVLLVDGPVDDHHVRQGRLHLVHARELRAHPQRELERGDVDRAVDRPGRVGRVAREVEPRDGQARVVAAVEVERGVLLHDAHADDRVLDRAHGTERRAWRVARGRHHDLLPVAARPVEVACQVHAALVVREPDPCAHRAAPVVVGAARGTARRRVTTSCPVLPWCVRAPIGATGRGAPQGCR